MRTKEVLDVCPFDLDEPTKLWRAGVTISPAIMSDKYYHNGLAFLTESDALLFRGRFADRIISVEADVYTTTLEELRHVAPVRGWQAILVVTSTGRVIEEYPV
jgi:hypothetical protein